VSNRRGVVNYELERIWKEVSKVLPQTLPEATVKE
jgi:hypothetical protein